MTTTQNKSKVTEEMKHTMLNKKKCIHHSLGADDLNLHIIVKLLTMLIIAMP